MIAKDRGMVMGAIAIVGCIAGVGGTEGQPYVDGCNDHGTICRMGY